MVHFLILPAVASFLGAADPTKDREALKGRWRVVEYHNDGSAPPKEKIQMMRIVIKGDAMHITTGKKTEKYTFTLDPKATPRAIVLREGADPKGKAMPGIYELKGATLRIGVDFSGKKLTEFPTKPRSGCTLLVLEREKK
jgi:uncharacterized protein (TIGR03067 family)